MKEMDLPPHIEGTERSCRTIWVTPRGFCMDVKTNGLRAKGFVSA